MSRFLSALAAITSSREAGDAEWSDLADCVNTLETMVGMGKLVASEVMPLVESATVAMKAAARRHLSGGRMGFDGPGLQTMRDVVDVYQQCLDGFTYAEMAAVQRETQRRVWAAASRARADQSHETEVISL